MFDSKVFNHTFDYDNWPGTHLNDETIIRPYNDSLFHIRNSYKEVFYDKELRPIEELAAEDDSIDSSKVYKIKYSVNLLPQVGFHIRKNLTNGKLESVNTEAGLMQLISESEELDIFNTETIQ